MSTLALERIGEVSVAIAPDAITRRDAAVSWAQMFDAVTTPEQQAEVVEAMKPLREIERGVEADRKAVKAPVLDLGRAVDAKAAQFVEPVAHELRRLSNLVAQYQFEERKRMAEAEAKRQEEIRKAAEVQRKAEEERRKAEAAGRPAPPPPPPAPPLPPPVPFREPPKPAGLVVRDVWQFEVLDLRALYAARPELVKLEAKAAEINAAIARGERTIPGLRIWSEMTAGVRV